MHDAHEHEIIAFCDSLADKQSRHLRLVAEQLFPALAFMKVGRRSDGSEPAAWTPIYHRDLVSSFALMLTLRLSSLIGVYPQVKNNVFIHYPPNEPGCVSRFGRESNAFPDIVLGDFGNSAIEGDDITLLPVSSEYLTF